MVINALSVFKLACHLLRLNMTYAEILIKALSFYLGVEMGCARLNWCDDLVGYEIISSIG